MNFYDYRIVAVVPNFNGGPPAVSVCDYPIPNLTDHLAKHGRLTLYAGHYGSFIAKPCNLCLVSVAQLEPFRNHYSYGDLPISPTLVYSPSTNLAILDLSLHPEVYL